MNKADKEARKSFLLTEMRRLETKGLNFIQTGADACLLTAYEKEYVRLVDNTEVNQIK